MNERSNLHSRRMSAIGTALIVLGILVIASALWLLVRRSPPSLRAVRRRDAPPSQSFAIRIRAPEESRWTAWQVSLTQFLNGPWWIVVVAGNGLALIVAWATGRLTLSSYALLLYLAQVQLLLAVVAVAIASWRWMRKRLWEEGATGEWLLTAVGFRFVGSDGRGFLVPFDRVQWVFKTQSRYLVQFTGYAPIMLRFAAFASDADRAFFESILARRALLQPQAPARYQPTAVVASAMSRR